ncbi:CMP/dCMP deaminase zinc-binding protein [Sporothrix schenckii 1099-18]|uniref:CMP/dCMP deaminase zinc-binding protein n=1 Tax=Sporothrix schenckii 1099-18 TaxID=1397361 RepID=A0A0F2MB69_SPOSC|nr:CMP/dCMP deaminase zinc-binding protein [Sporothrix schenckii 1099-18]KJR86334.1 CMP/dCMP deaminase zinc-binding protein [Sporothrix schenckii 1099-18]
MTTPTAPAGPAPAALLAKLLEVNEKQIVPLTATGVASGSKVFGAAIFTRDGLEAHTVATNNERDSPLLHGEINCIQTFFATPAEGRPATADCIFFATHEPCSLCLSGITWSGFREFYYLFTYEDSRDLFAIPYDIDILESVFRVPAPGDTPATLAERPLYNKTNKFFTSASLADLVARIEDPAERAHWAAEVARVKALYRQLSETYQEGKKGGAATSSVWK